ncbi:hypothetical protein L7F22_065918 [Adiantum nelumboides]|nr:hypothetical protein [Adiantum nelumboides]
MLWKPFYLFSSCVLRAASFTAAPTGRRARLNSLSHNSITYRSMGTSVLEKEYSSEQKEGVSVGGGVQDIFGEDSATEDQLVTPWSRSIASGLELLRNPQYNKGLAFAQKERENHYLLGLLPPAQLTQELQVEKIMNNIRSYSDSIQKYIAIMGLQERNTRLFFRVLIENVEEMLPIVYTPTVGEACQKYGSIFQHPRGLYVSLNERGKILDVLKNWPEKLVSVIVVTDGERILGLGDLGCQGMGIPVGKLALYTAIGGVRDSACLPITLDVGTNNEDLLKDKFYTGLRQKRVTGKEYDDFLHEFMWAVKQAYGEKVLVQFEDFANHNAFKLLERYQKTHLVFNDDIQGTSVVILGGILAGLKSTGENIRDQTFLFFGAGEVWNLLLYLILAPVKYRAISLNIRT